MSVHVGVCIIQVRFEETLRRLAAGTAKVLTSELSSVSPLSEGGASASSRKTTCNSSGARASD